MISVGTKGDYWWQKANTLLQEGPNNLNKNLRRKTFCNPLAVRIIHFVVDLSQLLLRSLQLPKDPGLAWKRTQNQLKQLSKNFCLKM